MSDPTDPAAAPAGGTDGIVVCGRGHPELECIAAGARGVTIRVNWPGDPAMWLDLHLSPAALNRLAAEAFDGWVAETTAEAERAELFDNSPDRPPSH